MIQEMACLRPWAILFCKNYVKTGNFFKIGPNMDIARKFESNTVDAFADMNFGLTFPVRPISSQISDRKMPSLHDFQKKKAKCSMDLDRALSVSNFL